MKYPAMTPLPDTLHFSHKDAPCCSVDTGTLSGLRHRTVIDSTHGAAALALWQEEHLPGFQVPLHLHDCEEIITVISGTIEAHIEDLSHLVHPGESILIPEWRPHGFRVVSSIPVKLLAIFSNASPCIYKIDGTLSLPPWAGGTNQQFDEGVFNS